MRALTFLGAALAVAAGAGPRAAADAPRPNIVHIFADDMGWGTGQFNNPSSVVETPNLNALAGSGLNFTRGYAATVCSPSRGMLMTGFHPGHGFNDRNGNIGAGIRDEDVTVAEVLKTASYKTSVFGKWGWGGSNGGNALRPNPEVNTPSTLPQNQGFDEFYGYLNHGRAHSFQVDSLWTTTEPFDDNSNGIDEVGEKYQPNQDSGLWLEKTGNNAANDSANYTHDLIGLKSEAFVRDNAGAAEPFYMQVSYTIPHFDLDEIVNTNPLVNLRGDVIAPGGLAQYAATPGLADKERKHAAMISRMDASIGSLIDRLDDPDGDGDTSDSVLDNTLIIFSTDNGPTPEDGLGNSGIDNLNLAGGLRGGKRDQYEGGIRVPMLVRWDAAIDPSRRGTTDSTPTDLADFLATAADLAGAETPLGIDGVSIAPQITGTVDSRTKVRPYLVTENFEGSTTGETRQNWAIIRGDEKLVRLNNGTYELYDLGVDSEELSPLDLNVPSNAALRDELIGLAVGDGAGFADNYYARERSWAGGDGAALEDVGNWNDPSGQVPAWQATVNNITPTARVAVVQQSTRYLGLEVRGDGAEQVVDVLPGQTLTGRNEVLVGAGGRVELAAATLSTNRWVDVHAGGRIGGDGVIEGRVYNEGALAPGRAADLPGLPDPPEPEPLVPSDLDTGLVNLVTFDFTGVQDDAPLTATSVLNANVSIEEGFNFGPGTSARHPGGGSTDVGNEFNVQGFTVGGSLSNALANNDYLSFTLDPGAGGGIVADSVSFQLWRNGVNAATNYAIFTSADGFDDPSDAAGQFLNINSSGITNQELLTATLPNSGVTPGPFEVRIYGWGSGNSAGNTHFNFVSFNGAVVAAPTLAFDFTGVQDTAPLTALSAAPAELAVTSGLDFGPGVLPKSQLDGGPGTDAGDEFNVAGWGPAASLAAAITQGDYLTFTVQATPGLAVIVDSVSFNLWRNGPNAPTDYAVTSSLDGFAAGAELVSETITDDGIGNQHTVTGQVGGAAATQDEVEFRLYGWNAGGGGNTHVNAVSLRASFQTVFDAALDPTGRLEIDGDLFHLSSAVIELELGGADNSNPVNPEYDTLAVTGDVEIEGDLELALVDGYTPAQGEAFTLLEAGAVSGEFASLLGAAVSETLHFELVYSPTTVMAVVTSLLDGDFNLDGEVDAADFTLWRDSLGDSVTAFTGADADGNGQVDTADYAIWKTNFGASLAAGSAAAPEPSAALATSVAGVAMLVRRPRRRTHRRG